MDDIVAGNFERLYPQHVSPFSERASHVDILVEEVDSNRSSNKTKLLSKQQGAPTRKSSLLQPNYTPAAIKGLHYSQPLFRSVASIDDFKSKQSPLLKLNGRHVKSVSSKKEMTVSSNPLRRPAKVVIRLPFPEARARQVNGSESRSSMTKMPLRSSTELLCPQ